MFHSTTDVELTSSSHGEGTAYCGLVFHRYYIPHYNNSYLISTGIGTYDTHFGDSSFASGCFAHNDGPSYDAYCSYKYFVGNCPKGWGSYASYLRYEPGCYYGTYYPNQTPAIKTDVYTGSCNLTFGDVYYSAYLYLCYTDYTFGSLALTSDHIPYRNAVGVGSYIVCGNDYDYSEAGVFADNPYIASRAASNDGSMRLRLSSHFRTTKSTC